MDLKSHPCLGDVEFVRFRRVSIMKPVWGETYNLDTKAPWLMKNCRPTALGRALTDRKQDESLLKSLWMISQRTNGQKVIDALDLNIPAGGLKFVSFVSPIAGSSKIMQVTG